MISITVQVDDHKPFVMESDWKACWDSFDRSVRDLVHVLVEVIVGAVVSCKDDELAASRPASWRSRGKEERWLLSAVGKILIRRRVFRDEEGKRHKPLDDAMHLVPYQRVTRYVTGLGAYLASEETYRVAAEALGEVVQEKVSRHCIQRSVWQMGMELQRQEEDEREAVFARGADAASGQVRADILFGETDGTYISLQREKAERAEVRVGVMYSGKERIAQGRWGLRDKVVFTAMCEDSEAWQENLLLTANAKYDLAACKCLVVGGDGGAWVRGSFDRLGVSGPFQLDRYHMFRAVRRVPAECQKKVIGLVQQAMREGFEAVEEPLWDLAQEQRSVRSQQRVWEVYQYLGHNRDGVKDYRLRLGLNEEEWRGLGTIEGNVDKLVVRRMKGRGMSWRTRGAKSMLALIRHRSELRHRAITPMPIPPFKGPCPAPPRPKTKDADYLRHAVPIIHSERENDPEVQWLKRRINGLPILSFPKPLP